MTSMRHRMSRTGRAIALLGGVAGAAAGCAPVPYTVDWSELVLLPPDKAVAYLQSLPDAAPALTSRPDAEHCEFATAGVRVAAGNPQHAQRVAVDLRAEARKLADERTRVQREQRRVADGQRDRLRWMRAHGFAELAAEQARLEHEHRDPQGWLRLRGLPADQIDRAQAGIERERAAMASRQRPVDQAMAEERTEVADRLRAIEAREAELQQQIDTALGRVHEVVPYDRVAFVVYRRLGGTMEFDVRYAVQDDPPIIDGCGFRLQPEHPETPSTVRRIATALSALGAEGQAGVTAEPRIGGGRRYSARPDDIQQVTSGAPSPGGQAVPPLPSN